MRIVGYDIVRRCPRLEIDGGFGVLDCVWVWDLVWGAAFGRSPTKVPIPPPLSCGGGTGASEATRFPRPLSCGRAGGERVVKIVGYDIGRRCPRLEIDGGCLFGQVVALTVSVSGIANLG